MPRLLFQKPFGRLLAEEPDDVFLTEEQRHNETVMKANETIFGKGYLTPACDVSNDPPADGEIVDLRVCNVTQYQCGNAQASDSESNLQDVDLVVEYDYEVHFNPQAQFSRVLPFVEESILESLAAAMGLTRCSASAGRKRRKRRLQNDQEFSNAQQDRFLGVRLDPRDRRDERFDECIVSVQQGDEASECLPVRGALTLSLGLTQEEMQALAKLPPQEQEAIRAAVWGVLDSRMDDDVFVVPGNIERVAFVGDRQAIENNRTDTGATTKEIDDEEGLSGLGKGLVSAVSLLFFLVLLAFLFLFRRKRKDNERDVGIIPPVDGPEDGFLHDEDEENWHRRRGVRDDGLGSLAYTDSLALQPQSILPDDKSDTEESASTSSLSPSPYPTPPRKPVGSQSYSIAEDYSVSSSWSSLKGDTRRARGLSNKHVRAIVHAGSKDSLLDGFYDNDVIPDCASDSTPRRVLQMS